MPATKKEDKLELQQNQTTQQTVPAQNSTVQQAQSALKQLSGRNYQSQWQTQINTMMDQYLNRDKFSYDVNADALYQQLRDQYRMMGQNAMMDTMGQATALTGGYGNSYAQSVGQQAYQGYMQQLSDKVPEMYQLALNRYLSEGSQMQDNIALMMQQDSLDYDRYRDQIADQDDTYNKLIALMTQYGYEPTAEEMTAAGMTQAQTDAILGKNRKTSGGEPDDPLLSPEILAYYQLLLDQQEKVAAGGNLTFADVGEAARLYAAAGGDNAEINDYLNNAKNAGIITPSQLKSLKYTFGY